MAHDVPTDAQLASGTYDPLSLDNQLCFPLYVVSKELTRHYKPFLDPLDLTYTQYVTMMALWEQDGIPVKELGARLYLDSATLTPLLKRLEAHGYVTRCRSQEDERSVIISLTNEGRELRERAVEVPHCIWPCLNLEPAEAEELRALLKKMLHALT